MKEYWINVYVYGKHRIYGLRYSNLVECILAANSVSQRVAYRIHVRLK